MADDPDYFGRDGEEVYRDEGTVYEKAMTVYGEPEKIDREDMTAITKENTFMCFLIKQIYDYVGSNDLFSFCEVYQY